MEDNEKTTDVTATEEKPKRFGSFTRRSFLSQLGAAGIAATATPVLAAAGQQAMATPEAQATPMPEGAR